MSNNSGNKIQPVILIILDGWGVAPPNKGNAISLAKTPVVDSLIKKYPHTEICSHGLCAGLPKNQPGNSEAGHLNLGAGRIVKDDAVYIFKSIKDGTFFKNPAFLEGILHLKKDGNPPKFSKKTQAGKKSKVHLMGLVTEEDSAHSSPEHWLAMIRFLDQQGVDEVFLHLFTDGRDSPQHAAVQILERFEKQVEDNHQYFNNQIKVRIASVVGRFYAMDRTKQWENIEKAYDLLTLGKGLKAANAKEAIVQAYNRKETDEFISPTMIVNEKGQSIATVDNNDLVIFMNLRSDRARELTKAFTQKEFNKKNPGSFKRKRWPRNLFFIALTDFGPDLDNVRTAYPSREVKNSLPVVLNGLQQFYIAETEKYAHATFFFNGGYDHPVAGEERVLIPSPNVSHYDLTPKMSAGKIYQRVLQEIRTEKPDFIMVNFCNPDMLGHTGNIQAAVEGIEYLDQKLGQLIKIAQKEKYLIIITADHGNAEEMIDLKTGEVETSHTTNLVPFILVSPSFSGGRPRKGRTSQLRNDGKLADVAPTILDLMKIKKPKEMTGASLIKK